MQVLLVSRPLRSARPDGTVQLTRTLAAALASASSPPGAPVRVSVLAPWGEPPPAPATRVHPSSLAHPDADRFWPAPTLARLALCPRHVVRHYLFTPTPRTVRLLWAIHRVRPGPTVQTLCSAPPPEANLRQLVFADRVVALSSHTRDRLLGAGIPASRVAWIPPAVPPTAPDPRCRQRVRGALGVPASAQILAYLGDWDEAGAALTVVRALPSLLEPRGRHAVLACRPKGPGHREVAAAARRILREGGAPRDRVHLRGTLPDAAGLSAADLAAGADLALLPAARLPHKMDHPLALLESLRAGIPAVVASEGPLADLVHAGAAAAVPPGDAAALAACADEILRRPARWRALSVAARRWCASGPGSVEALAAHHLHLYQGLVPRSPGPEEGPS